MKLFSSQTNYHKNIRVEKERCRESCLKMVVANGQLILEMSPHDPVAPSIPFRWPYKHSPTLRLLKCRGWTTSFNPTTLWGRYMLPVILQIFQGLSSWLWDSSDSRLQVSYPLDSWPLLWRPLLSSPIFWHNLKTFILSDQMREILAHQDWRISSEQSDRLNTQLSLDKLYQAALALAKNKCWWDSCRILSLSLALGVTYTLPCIGRGHGQGLSPLGFH